MRSAPRTSCFSDGTDVYIGQAADCSGTGGSTETDGCTSGSLPIGTPVDVGGVATGTLAYNSWITMQTLGETNPDTCAYNDLALVRLAPADATKVNPSIPFFGGPTGVGGATAAGDKVYSYGNSSLRGGITTLSPKRGVSLGDDGNGWSHTVYTVTPGIPGDSGSAFLERERPGDRHPVDGGDRAARREQRRRRCRGRARVPELAHVVQRDPRAGYGAVQREPADLIHAASSRR